MIRDKIHSIRGTRVILDRDLADLYDVSTKRLNEQVKRNMERFPYDFMFQLSESERDELVAKCDYLSPLKYSYQLPYAFTEHGVTILSGVLRSKKAIEVNIQIIRAFVAMRKFLSKNNIFTKFQQIDQKLFKHNGDINNDNYVDESVLELLSKKDVNVIIYTKHCLLLDQRKFNEQYGGFI